MSQRRAKDIRYYQRMEYLRKFEAWLASEPPMFLFWAWRKWLKNRPVRKDCELGRGMFIC